MRKAGKTRYVSSPLLNIGEHFVADLVERFGCICIEVKMMIELDWYIEHVVNLFFEFE